MKICPLFRSTIFMLAFLFTFLSTNNVARALEGTVPYYQDLRSPVESVLRLNTNNVLGSFSYNYTFDIPPGRNGMQPNVVLSYSSQDNSLQNIYGNAQVMSRLENRLKSNK